MRSGSLRHKIDIKTYTEIKNEYGEIIKTWVSFAVSYASVTPVSGKEYFESKKTNASITHKIKIRFINGITPLMKIFYDGREFEIDSVLNIREENKELLIMATEIING